MCVHNGIEAFKNQQIAVMHRLDQTKTVKEKIDCPTLVSLCIIINMKFSFFI